MQRQFVYTPLKPTSTKCQLKRNTVPRFVKSGRLDVGKCFHISRKDNRSNGAKIQIRSKLFFQLRDIEASWVIHPIRCTSLNGPNSSHFLLRKYLDEAACDLYNENEQTSFFIVFYY